MHCTMSLHRAVAVSVVYLLVYYAWIDPIPFANSLSAAPPSKNPDVLRSYVFLGKARCWEVLSNDVVVSNSDNDAEEEEEEDEVEYWYPTRKRHFEFSIPSVVSSSTSSATTTIRQTSFGCGKLGAEVWESSVALCLYLGLQQEEQKSSCKGKRILELGAGCGLPSVLCRDYLEASAVLATDFWETTGDDFDGDRLVPTKFHGLNLEYNVHNSHSRDVSTNDGVAETLVQRLDWHDRESATAARDSFRPDLVIGSDLVYYSMDVEPLLNVLEILLDASSSSSEQQQQNNNDNKSTTRVVLALPLSPAKREALPEFRSKVQERFSQTHIVQLQELDLIREDADSEGEDSVHLFIDIVPK